MDTGEAKACHSKFADFGQQIRRFWSANWAILLSDVFVSSPAIVMFEGFLREAHPPLCPLNVVLLLFCRELEN